MNLVAKLLLAMLLLVAVGVKTFSVVNYWKNKTELQCKDAEAQDVEKTFFKNKFESDSLPVCAALTKTNTTAKQLHCSGTSLLCLPVRYFTVPTPPPW